MSAFNVFAETKTLAISRAKELAKKQLKYGYKLYPDKVFPEGNIQFLTGKVKVWRIPYKKVKKEGS